MLRIWRDFDFSSQNKASKKSPLLVLIPSKTKASWRCKSRRILIKSARSFHTGFDYLMKSSDACHCCHVTTNNRSCIIYSHVTKNSSYMNHFCSCNDNLKRKHHWPTSGSVTLAANRTCIKKDNAV